jgi:quercetin dioxygenase-like cupin family protein
MKIAEVPFCVVDWASVSPTKHAGKTGEAFWRTFEKGNIRVRMVEYTPGYVADHWCKKGHFGCILEGRFEIEFRDGVSIFEQGDGVFIPEGEEHKHRAKALTDIVRVVFVEDI